MKKSIITIFTAFLPLVLFAQNEELIKYGDFDQWLQRDIKESSIIGGETRTLFEVAPYAHWNKANGKQNIPYTNQGGSPWATSNVYARVSGISKTNACVYRDKHNSGYCAKLVTQVVKVKVLGMINISVLASGSIFTGEMIEPITGTDNPMSKMDLGMPFNRRPKAIKLDYRVKLTDSPNRIRQTGFSKVSTVSGKDMPEMVVILQQRKENADGSITAKRVGTQIYKFSQSTDGWVEGRSFDIMYGDITKHPDFTKRMDLMRGESTIYARNSKGENVPVNENEWADASATPTHAIVKFDSSHGGAYIGSIGTTLWLDNVKWVY
jgi:hypothetical protein